MDAAHDVNLNGGAIQWVTGDIDVNVGGNLNLNQGGPAFGDQSGPWRETLQDTRKITGIMPMEAI